MRTYFAILTRLNKNNVPVGTKIIKTKSKNTTSAENNILEYIRCYNTFHVGDDSYLLNGTCHTLNEIELI